MKMKVLFTLVALCLFTVASGQIKIGDNPQNIDAASVLELESNDRVLVITRISEAQMNSIVPSQGALVYNIDAQCIFYYNGANWINLCDSLALNFTTDPIVNSASTIVITENGDDVNFEVGEISSENIMDFSINSNDIQNNSITADKLAPDSVGSEELQTNTVGDDEINYDEVTLSDFNNDAGFITGANIVSGAPNNAITDNGGAFYDDSQLVSDIADNTAAIAADGDTNSANEIQNLSLNGNQLTITGGNSVNLPTADGSDTNIQGGTNINVTGIGTAGNPYIINNTFTEVDGSNTNELQNISEVLADGNNAGGQLIKNLGTPVDPQDAATKAYVDAAGGGGEIPNNELITDVNLTGDVLTITEAGTDFQVNLSGLGGGGSTELADQVTIVGDGSLGNEFEVADNAINSAKITDGAVNTIDLANDAVTTTKIVNGGVGTIDLADDAVTTVKIAPGGADQILRTNAAGTAVNWEDLPAGGNQNLSQVLAVGNDANNTVITNLADPTLQQDAATKAYVDAVAGGGAVEVADQITITGIGTAVDPFKIEPSANADEVLTTNAVGDVIWAAPQAGAVGTDGVTIQGDGTVGNEIQVVDGGIGTTQLADDAVTTIKILDNNVTPDKIAEGTANQVLTTDAVGDVVWAAPQAGAAGTDGVTIQGDGTTGNEIQVVDGGIGTTQIADDAVTTVKILDNNVTPDKIAEGTANQVLTTDAAGDVVWAAAQAGAVGTDGLTIEGDGTTGNEIQVLDGGIDTQQLANDAVTTVNILDNNVTPDKIAEGTANQVLTTDAAGDVIWEAAQSGAVATDGVTIQGDGTTGNEIQVVDGGIDTQQLADDAVTTVKILDNNVTPDKIAEGTANQVLTTDAAGDVIWAAAQSGAVATDGVTIQGDGTTGNEIQVVDGGIGTTQIADDAVTTVKILDNNVTPDKIAEGAANEVLTTNAAGDVVWAAATGHVGTPNSVFFADNPGGAPTDAGNQFFWDPNGRDFGIGTTGALYIGTDGNPQSDITKLHIAENLNGQVSYPLHLQNYTNNQINQSSVGVLFSVEATSSYGKGALVYERTDGFARGKFHFLQDPAGDQNNADINNAVMTVENDGDVGIGTTTPAQRLHVTGGNLQLDGDLIARNGAGNLNDVLTITATGTEWAPAGAGSDTNLADTNLTQTAATDRTYDINGGNIAFTGNGNFGIGNAANPPSNKLHVAGTIRSEGGILSSDGTVNEPAYRFNADTNTGMFRPGADQLAFSTNGTEGMRVYNNQTTRIGADDSMTPDATLEVNGSLAMPIASDVFLLDASNFTTIVTSPAAVITLPAANTATGRIYIIKNNSGGNITTTINYVDSIGASGNSIAVGVVQLQSDGTNWHQIN